MFQGRAIRMTAEPKERREGLRQLAYPKFWVDTTQHIRRLRDIADGRYAPPKSETRNDLVLRFKTRLAEAGHRISNKDIWRAAKHKQARQFFLWKRGEDRQPGQKHGATREDDRNFHRILAMDVPTFLEHLKKINLNTPIRSRA